MTDLTAIKVPFGLLDQHDRQNLIELSAHDMGMIDVFQQGRWQEWKGSEMSPDLTYRVKPDPMWFDWAVLRPEYVCAAVGPNGVANATTERPHLLDDDWQLAYDAEVTRVDSLVSYRRGNYRWRESLIWRPGHEPECRP